MKSVYITGASGALGSAFAAHFAKLNGYRTVAVSRKHCPVPIGSSLVEQVVPTPFDANWLSENDENATLLHCAGLSDPRVRFSNFGEVLREHVLPHIDMVETLLSKGWIGRLVFISSGGTVYGDATQLPIPETHPTSPKSFYGLHKLCLERAFEQLSAERGFELVILRVSNPYGSMVTKPTQGVVPILINSIRYNETFHIIGEGTAERDYIEIGDLCTAVQRSVDTPLTKPFEVINIGTGVGVTLNKLIEIVSTCMGKAPIVEHVPAMDDVQSNVLCCRRAHNILDWQAKTPLEAGVMMYLDHLLSEEGIQANKKHNSSSP